MSLGCDLFSVHVVFNLLITRSVIVGTAMCKFVTQMYTPFVNQSAPHESARYQNDNCRRCSRSAMC